MDDFARGCSRLAVRVWWMMFGLKPLLYRAQARSNSCAWFRDVLKTCLRVLRISLR